MAGMADTVPLNSFESTTTVNSRAPLTSTCSSFDHQENNIIESHAYESPLELQRELERERNRLRQDGHRKKQCLLYEPTNISDRKFSDEDSDGVRYVHAHDKLYRTVFILLFIFFIASISISLLALFGIQIGGPTCPCSEKPSESKVRAAKTYSKPSDNSVITAAVENNIMQIQRNFTYLYSVVIPALHAKIEELKKKAELKVDLSKMVGPQGPQGAIGPPGPAGVGNLSQCTHQSYTISSQISKLGPDGPQRTVAVTQRIITSKDKVITGITCSSHGAAEYNLIHTRMPNGYEAFFCRCAGIASSFTFRSQDDKIHCNIHWWECPAIS